ncbi:helix-turn-helix domain-containing protein [Plantactinospora soyae]|uniref:XRE family transcriptional regulator n=1 Tax=Plantactinospora soyae TaxID=1544732 RepID=A0A927MD10_9ACTN|nr:helix-turn-helix transcriptional regulator [Plantactinospora soyae]MBE1490881.1 hypothetical protein [Plantactinospora soyae]
MTFAGRALSPAVVEALRYRPGVVHAVTPAPVDLAVLPSFFNELLGELPWWNRAWRVTQVEPAHPRETPWNRGRSGAVEVSVPGTASCGAGDVLPFSGQVRFKRDRLIRFQAKLGDVVIGPGAAPAGTPEPHPFGTVFSRLMDLRGISVREMAMGSGRSMSTINGLRSGYLIPHRKVLAHVPEVLKMSAEDLAAIAGLDPEDNR